MVGKFDQGLGEAQETMRLDPNSAFSYQLLGGAYLGLNRLAEAKAIRQKQINLKVDTIYDHADLYSLAFLERDEAGMQHEAEWANGKPDQFVMLATVAEAEASLGKLQKAREDYGQAVEIAQRGKFEEVAAATAARHALLEAQFGNLVQANDGARSALAMDRSRRTLAFVGLAQSMAGNVSQAAATADELSKHFPAATIVKYVWAPAIRAEIEISRGNSDKAIELLRAASPYEFGWASRELPSYVRGQAYLKARQGKEAAVEFQRILDHRGICITSALCALSHLQLGRAHALAGDATSARTAYQDFLALWKDADPDIPILKEAKAEYAKLQ